MDSTAFKVSTGISTFLGLITAYYANKYYKASTERPIKLDELANYNNKDVFIQGVAQRDNDLPVIYKQETNLNKIVCGIEERKIYAYSGQLMSTDYINQFVSFI